MPTTPRERGQTAKAVLKVEWAYPVYNVEQPQKSGSVAKVARRALSAEEAFRYVAGDDPRPLLVLRECLTCNGTDDALLSKGTDNERTFLLSTWFHCVKLPVDVMQKDHPFYEMFGHENVEHLFVSTRDGALKIPLESDTSRTQLWDSMSQVLAATYKKDTQPVVKLMQKSLDRLDVLDTRVLELRAKRNALLEEEGSASKKLVKIDRELDEAQKEIEASMAELALAAKIELKPSEGASSGASAGPAKAGR